MHASGIRFQPAAAALALALTPTAPAAAHEPRPSRFSFNRDVRPILERHCTGCHTTGGAGPMTLEDYRDVLPWVAAIRREVLERRMPPWAPEAGHRSYRHERLLSAREIDVLADWITGATPEGDPTPESAAASSKPSRAERAVEPPRVDPPEADVVRKPVRGSARETVTLRPEAPVPLGAHESQKRVCLVLPTRFERARWVTRIEIVPGTARLVRRAVLWRGPRCDADAAPLLVWVPGQPAVERREGLGDRLPARETLALQLEYVKPWDDDGVALQDLTGVRLELGAAGRETQQLDASLGPRLARTVEVQALQAVMLDASATSLRVEALVPDGPTAVLLELRAPDPLWLGRYELAEPLRLPAGSVLRAAGGRVYVEVASPVRDAPPAAR